MSLQLRSLLRGRDGSRTKTVVRAAAALMLTAAVGGSLVACSPGSGSGSGAPSASGTPVPGGTLTMGVGLPLQDFDPYQGVDQDYIVTKTLYSNLIRYTDDFQPVPDMATNWTIAPDNLSVTITLRDAKFSDGTPVTSNDIVTGVKRALDPSVGETQTGVASFISGSEAVDDHTVKVDFNTPTSEDRVLDWMSYFPIVEAADNNPDYLKTAAAGSGPFMLSSYDPGNQLTIVKNPNYYDPSKPYLDKVVFKFFSDQDAMVSALQSGEIDGDVWGELHYDAQLQNQFQIIDDSTSAQTMMFYLNPADPPFDNQLCRQAVMRAVDRQGIMTQVQGTHGQIVPGPFPPNSPAFDSSLFDQVGFDLNAAKQGIDANCATKEATAVVEPTIGVDTAFTKIQADLASIGFKLNLINADNATFVSLVRQGGYQMSMFPTVNPFKSAVSLTTNRGFSPTSTNYWWLGNTGGVPQDYVDAVKAVSTAVTPDAITAANAQMNKAIVNDAWATGVYTMIDQAILSPKVQGFQFAVGAQLLLENTWIQQ